MLEWLKEAGETQKGTRLRVAGGKLLCRPGGGKRIRRNQTARLALPAGLPIQAR